MTETNESPLELPQETLDRLREELNVTPDDLAKMPRRRLLQTFIKLEIPNRPLERICHERGDFEGDDGEIPVEGHARALAQLLQLRDAQRNKAFDVAGVPSGPTVMNVSAREEDPTAGLNANNTGWTALGPGNIGGRTRAIVIDPNDPNRIFAAGVAGGVWRSTDGGASWSPTDDLMANLAVCSLVMDPTDSNTIYAGTGEGFSNVDAVRGDGIFVTRDGGNSWTEIAFTAANSNFFYVNSLAISSDGLTLLAGTNDGIFRSTDSGQNWTQALTEGIGKVALDPTNSSNGIAGGVNNGRAYYSTDGGATWQEASRANVTGRRVEVGYAAANPSTVYASVEGRPSQIWRSTDGGHSYHSRNANSSSGGAANFLGAQGWYDNVLWAGDPTNADLLIVGGIDLWKSTDGGNTLTPISTWWDNRSAHADHHAIVSDPGFNGTTNRKVYFGNDGGIYRTDDVTTVGNNASAPYINGWVNLNNGYAVTQFYYGAGHLRTDTLMGGTQDNGTLRYTPNQGVDDWNAVWGGDGGDMAADPTDAQVWYGEYVYLQIFRDTSGGASASLADDYICGRYWDGTQWTWKPVPFTIPDAQNSQAQFIAPFELDPNDANRLLGGAMALWRTNDAKTPNSKTPPGGPSWASIKPPIGNNVRSDSITSIAIADGNSDIVLVGHANGDIYRSTNATASSPTWQQIDTNGIGANRHCLALTIDPDDHNIIYAAFGGYQANNLWRTSDGGQTWTNISNGLPSAPIRDVSLHPQRSSWVYLATEFGVFASEDSGTTWSPTNEGPANVACRDLFWMGSKLVCVTHGRGMFEIDLHIANAFPAPVLAFEGTEDYTVGGNPFTRYKLSVTNHAVYPDSLFRPAPDLPPCGANTNSSRTWVDIYDGDNDQRLYGFCALNDAEDLGRLWFALPKDTTPPTSVYVVLRDRRCQAAYRSNAVSLGGGPGPTPTCTLSQVLVVLSRTGNRIEVVGDATGCKAGARVSIEGPKETTPRRLSNLGSLDTSGHFDIDYRGPEVDRGSWRAIIVNPDGSDCCQSDFVRAQVRDETGGDPWWQRGR